ncbi:hypothetical protein [Microbispora sp. CA-102843]|uniref:hypothetical protein n=1 Tax=Microbispora sp. CA-102843 TaxID=3239952 RepID=UPI003D900CF0
MLALLLALGDDEPGGDVAQAEVLLAQVQGHGQHGDVGDGGAADGLAAAAGGFVAFQGAVADVFAFHPRQRREYGEVVVLRDARSVGSPAIAGAAPGRGRRRVTTG